MSKFSLICVIEAGRLEAQTLLMLTTLKLFGGALGTSRVVAFQGRSGEKISMASREKLAEMDVEYVYRPDLNHAPWFNYTNKIAAVQYAQDTFDTPWRVWLDSDILFLSEPSFVKAPPTQSVDFCARFEYLPPAVTEDNNEFEAYWRRVFDICGSSFDAVDFCDLDFPRRRMKPFFNSGVFLWRPATDFAEVYARNFYRILKARIAPKHMGPWIADQVTLAPTIEMLGLGWSMLPAEDHLMMFPGALDRNDFRHAVGHSNIVHYSKSRGLPHRDAFDPLVVARHPELNDIMRTFDALNTQSAASFFVKGRKYARRLRQEIFARTSLEL